MADNTIPYKEAFAILHPEAITIFERQKQERLENGDYLGYLGLFGHDERLDGFRRIHAELADADYWRYLGMTYTSADNFSPDREEWRVFLTSTRGEREMIMNGHERRSLAALPDKFRIYRGSRGPLEHQLGFSWTLDKKVAIFFVTYSGSERKEKYPNAEPSLLVGEVAKKNIIAVINERKEREILVDPRRVYEIESLTFT